jgi:hypothetical protein
MEPAVVSSVAIGQSRQRKHVDQLGIPNFRVLIEATTRERVAQMIEALEELTGSRGSCPRTSKGAGSGANPDPFCFTPRSHVFPWLRVNEERESKHGRPYLCKPIEEFRERFASSIPKRTKLDDIKSRISNEIGEHLNVHPIHMTFAVSLLPRHEPSYDSNTITDRIEVRRACIEMPVRF